MTDLVQSALEVYSRGWTPIPLRQREKRPAVSQWTHLVFESESEVINAFTQPNVGGIGLALGESSNGLIDVDLDHPKALRLKDHFLPTTAMRSGRAGARNSHYWFQVADGENAPDSTKRYRMPDGSTIVELRSTGGQTVIPPSIHPNGEAYIWEGEPFGGDYGPSMFHVKQLEARVASLAMVTILVDGWPQRGSRHEAYLALAGGLLRYGTGEISTVHPLWQVALPNIIRVVAEATLDEDGPETRASEVMGSTMERLNSGRTVQGFPTLAKLIGDDHAESVRRIAREIENILGHATRPSSEPITSKLADKSADQITDNEIQIDVKTLPPEERDPLAERLSTWEPVDLEPYLLGQVQIPEPGILYREDDAGLFYPGRVNSLFGRSESGKTWIALAAAQQMVSEGGKVLYIDCEDEPAGTLSRLMSLGSGRDDLMTYFSYVRPESPLAKLLFDRWGNPTNSEIAKANDHIFYTALDALNPELIVVDGLTVLYGLHGLDTNDASSTDRITTWLKSLTRNGKTTVIVIDHVAKGASRGALPLGSQHKIAMVQGSAIQVHPIARAVPGKVGQVELIVGKDRPGAVRMMATSDEIQVFSDVFINSTIPNVVRLELKVPQSGSVVIGDNGAKKLQRLAEDSQAILNAIADHPGSSLSKNEITLLLSKKIPDTRFRAALKALASDGLINVMGTTKGTRYELAQQPTDSVDD